MSEPQVQIKQKFTIDFPDRDWQKVSLTFFAKRHSLGNQMAKTFGIEFDGSIHGNNKVDKVESINYWGPTGSDVKVKKAFDAFKPFFDEGLYLSKEAVAEILDEINRNGSYTRKQFGSAANQNGKKGPTGGVFVPKNQAQADLFETIEQKDITFAVGPAGTGKTHVAMMKAVQMLKAGLVRKLVLSRPAQEAGERLGYLPGDMKEKLDPYMRPLYDELDKAYGNGAYKKMIDNGTIELCPVGMMRGRTFCDSFIILDEAQNCTHEMLLMAMTRFGEGSKMAITGDPRQSDLPPGQSGLKDAVDMLEGEEGIGTTRFTSKEIVRHKVVQTVVNKLSDNFGPKADFYKAAQPTPQQPAPANDAKAAPAVRKPRRKSPEV